MKKISYKIIFILITMLLILCINFVQCTNSSYASFAEFDDETADKQANEELKEQEEENKNNIGKSSNNYLSELSVEGYTITPAFDKQTINYAINEEIENGTLKINAVVDDPKATVSGNNEVKLEAGENNLRITVKAENGVERTYFIKATCKLSAEDSKQTNEEESRQNSIANIETENLLNTDLKNNENSGNLKTILGIVIGVLIVTIIIIAIKKKK